MFNFTDAIRRLCDDVVLRLPVFAHINMDQVGISFGYTRDSDPYGVFASVTPLRFRNGEQTEVRRGILWKTSDVLSPEGRPLLYILRIYMPRFQDLTLLAKMNTILHELYHIGENFDGDVRRFPGRCYAHGSSRKKYDELISRLVKEWLAKDPPPEVWHFLTLNFRELKERYGEIRGIRYLQPKIRPVKDPSKNI